MANGPKFGYECLLVCSPQPTMLLLFNKSNPNFCFYHSHPVFSATPHVIFRNGCNHQDFEPDLVVVSAGYDALEADELATASLQPEDYGR